MRTAISLELRVQAACPIDLHAARRVRLQGNFAYKEPGGVVGTLRTAQVAGNH